MPKMKIDLFRKQSLAWKALHDDKTTEIGYGGAAHGGKSFLGCTWVLADALKYPDTNWGVGRKELKRLKLTTLETFFMVCHLHGLKPGIDFRYDQQLSVIHLHQSGSKILLLDLAYQPNDPLYERFGSLLLTGLFIDESAEIKYRAVDVLQTRIGRKNNDEYGITPKLLETFNPNKGHVYARYYKPYKAETLPGHRTFIPALPRDNPYTSDQYIRQLERADEVTKQRLLFGNFEYDDDPSAMFDTNTMHDLFTNRGTLGEKYISADIARKGKDLTVIIYWEGLQAKEIYVLKKKRTTKVASFIDELAKKKQVGRSNIVIDDDGVGGGVSDQLPGCLEFVNNSRPIETKETKKKGTKPNYANLKAQCFFELARLAALKEVGITCDLTIQETIIEELEQIKERDMDKDDRKRNVVSKDKIKEAIGRSPDYADALMMRMYFELKHKQSPSLIVL